MTKERYRFNEWLLWLLAGFLKLLSRLPLWALYAIAYKQYLLFFYVLRYRRKLVQKNLQGAFPHKSREELQVIEKQFYRHLSHLMAEVIKLRTMPAAMLKRRCTYSPESIELLNSYHAQGKTIVIAMGHMGNWEWAGAAFPLWQKYKVITAYRPLRNRVFDSFMLNTRSRTGNMISPMKVLPREVIKLKNQVMAIALISDQTPTPRNAFWLPFLQRETPFYKGSELLAQKYDFPVFWGSVKKIKRGYYHIDIELLADSPASLETEGALTHLHAKALAKDIEALPHTWLWSHDRWKHQRPSDMPMVTPCSPE